MAERRMFAKAIVLSDAFLDMPMSARCLYFTLAMLADDDGFVNSPKSIMRQCGATTDDMSILIGKRFVLTFDSGVVVIKHWRIHNLIQKDRYRETKYLEEKSMLAIDENKAYTEVSPEVYPECIQNVSIPEPQVRLGKDSLVKDSIGEGSVGDGADMNVAHKPTRSTRFVPPTLEQVREYCQERRNGVDAERFVNYYTSKGWLVGKAKMKDWKAAVRTWEQNWKQGGQEKTGKSSNPFLDMLEDGYE